MNFRVTFTSLFVLLMMVSSIIAGGGGGGKKKVIIHVPYHVKKIHHTHTVYKIIKEKGHGWKH